MAVEDWQIDRFDGAMIRLTNGSNTLVLQAQPGGAYDFEEYTEDGAHRLIWDGDTVRLTFTKHDDGNIQMEFSQKNNGFPIALFNRLHPGLFDEMKAYADEQGGQPAEEQEPEDPSVGGRKRSNVKSRSRRASRSSRRRSRKA